MKVGFGFVETSGQLALRVVVFELHVPGRLVEIGEPPAELCKLIKGKERTASSMALTLGMSVVL